MLEHVNAVTLVVITVASVAFLFGVGACVGSMFGSRFGQTASRPELPAERRAPERLIRELERCVELGDCVTRDADTLTSLVAAQDPAVPRDVASAIAQLIKTTKSLAGRLQRMGDVGGLSRGASTATIRPHGEEDREQNKKAFAGTPSSLVSEPPAPAQGQTAGELRDSRRFPRSQFRGSAKATIYPLSSSNQSDPTHCTVLTRNLSCGGVGIAHSDRLFPQQIIVLEAVGKVLVGEIRWCRQVEDRFYVAGCRLVKAGD